jgi:hypothetical protein
MVFPNRPIENLENQDEIFHIVYDLDDRVQIPGTHYILGRRARTPDSAFLRGVPFAMRKVASWSPFVTTPMSATHGNGPRRLWSPSPARGRKMSYLALWQTTATAGNRAD